MRRGSRRLRVFAIIWAVLQFALPASATIVDARVAGASPDRTHVEATSGRDCVPSHSPDCAVCKHLSTSSLGSTPPAAAFGDGGREHALGGCITVDARTPVGVPLPRAPPAQS
jgi:hypothetical protein